MRRYFETPQPGAQHIIVQTDAGIATRWAVEESPVTPPAPNPRLPATEGSIGNDEREDTGGVAGSPSKQ